MPRLTSLLAGASVVSGLIVGSLSGSSTMNVIDVVIIVVVLVGVIRGLIRGFIRGLAGLAALILGIVAATQVYSTAASSAFFWVPGTRGPAIVAFIVVFLIVALALTWIGRLLSKVAKLASLGWVDHLAGGGLGFLKACIAIGVVLLLAVMAGLADSAALIESRLSPSIFRVTDWIVALIPEEARPQFEESYDGLREKWDRARGRGRAELVSIEHEAPEGRSQRRPGIGPHRGD
jgi:membrane protein required for colicin V production